MITESYSVQNNDVRVTVTRINIRVDQPLGTADGVGNHVLVPQDVVFTVVGWCSSLSPGGVNV